MSGLTLSHTTSVRQTSSSTAPSPIPSPRVKLLPHPRRSSISSNRNSERVSHHSASPPNVDPKRSSSIKPPALNPHLTSWKVETRAKLERVLSRGPSIRLLPSVIYPNDPDLGVINTSSLGLVDDEEDDEMSSVASEHATIMLDESNQGLHGTTRVSSSQSFYYRRRNSLSNPVQIEHQMYFSKRQSGFMFDPDESDEKKYKCALQFAEGVKELQLRVAKNL